MAAVVPDFLSHLNIVVVKPSCLQRVEYAQHVEPTHMNLFSHALGPYGTFHILGVGEQPVLYRTNDLLVLPNGGELIDIVLQKLYDEALGECLGSFKILEIPQSRVW